MTSSSLTTNAVQDLADLNARVVSMMANETNRARGVEETVGQAVRKLRNFLPSLRNEAHDTAERHREHHDGSVTIPMETDDGGACDNRRHSIKLTPARSTQERRLLGIEANIFLLFDRVFNIAGNEELLQVEYQFRLAVSMMYNIGLFLHKKGLETGQSVHLDKAVRYYTLALEMLLSAVQLREEDLLLELAMLNNIGHAQTALANFQQAADCLNYMRELITEHSDVLYSLANEENNAGSFLVLLFVSETESLALSPAA